MKMTLNYGGPAQASDVLFLGTFAKEKAIELPKWPRELKDAFWATPGAKKFDGKEGRLLFYHQGLTCIALGLGSRKKFNREALRRTVARAYRDAKKKYSHIAIHMDTLPAAPLDVATQVASEAILMAGYHFGKYLSKKKSDNKKREKLSCAPPRHRQNPSAP